MNHQPLTESLELANLRLRLRDELSFELQEDVGELSYIVKNRTSSEYFQIGIAEYAFISLLDGSTTVQEAVQEIAFRLGEDALSVRDALGTAHWLIQNRLAEPVSDSGGGQASFDYLCEHLETQKKHRLVSQLNPLFIKTPLFQPASFFQTASSRVGWIASKSMLVIWSALMLVALVCVFQNWQSIAIAGRGILAPHTWLWIAATFVLMKFIHEMAHGLFCHCFGGQVKEAGIVFLLFIPIPYVDVTSCWGFPSKWQRIAVSAAGMYVELMIAGLATLAWCMTNDPVLKFHLFNVMLTGSLTTLFFNANFLMRFDGYYIVSDLLGIPNLAQLGQQHLHYLGKRYMLGMKVPPAGSLRGRGLVIKSYGVAAFCWRIFIYVSLSIFATSLLYGFGIVLSILGIAMWIGLPGYRFGQLIFGKRQANTPDFRWIALVTTPICLGLLLFLFILPWPVQVSAPAYVQFSNPAIIRADASGIVKKIWVNNGDSVKPGDALIELENDDLRVKLLCLQMDLQQSQVRSRRHHMARDIAAYQAEVALQRAIEKQTSEASRQYQSLTIRAEVAGKVVARGLESMAGQHVRIGTELLQIVDEERKEIVLSVCQSGFDDFVASQGKRVIFAPSHSSMRFVTQLDNIEPTASSNVDIRLTSHAGGSLAVRPISQESADQQPLELIYPRFNGNASLDENASAQLISGSRGYVRLDLYPECVVMYLVKRTRVWMHQLFEAAERNSSHGAR